MADLHPDKDHCSCHWFKDLRLAVLVAAIGGWTLPAVAQMRPEPPGPLPPGAATPPQAAVPAAAKRTVPAAAKRTVPAAAIQTVPAADARPAMVVDVRIAGNRTLPLEKILPHIRTRAGRPFDLDLIAEDVRRLDRTRMFVDVNTYWRQVAGGRVVIFDVLERPLLQEVKYIGCKAIRKKTLLKETNLKAGDSLDPFAVEEARRKIEELYHKRGFSKARITLLEGNKPEDRRAIFLINEGKKQRIKWVTFVGNTIADDARLKTQIESKPPFLYLFKGELDRKQLDEDVERLTAYYRGLGFFRARIGRELSYNEKQDWVTISFVIDEGPRYKIRDVSLLGNKQYAGDELLAELKLRGGEYFNQAKMTADIGTLQDKYGSVGYVFAEVKADPRFLEEPGQLDLIYNITEGDRYRVGKINVRINGDDPHTRLTTVFNQLSLKPGDIIDIREIRASERRLRACGLFESNPATGQPPKIVFHPPGKKSQEQEEQVAERPRDRSSRGDGERGMGRGMGRGGTGRGMERGGMGGGGMGPDGDSPSFRGQSPDQAPRERVLDVTLDCGCMRDKGRGERGEGRECGETPRDCVAAVAAPSDLDSQLWRATEELTDALAERNRRRRPPQGHLIRTQYTPNAGQVNPASLPRSVATVGRSNRASDTAGQAGSGTQPVPPAERKPQYVSQRWPRGGATRPVDSPQGQHAPGPIFDESSPFIGGPPEGGDTLRTLDFEVLAHEAMTGRMMFGVGINSDAGLVGQIVIDEQNFDWTRFPRSWEDIRNSTAFRGDGQRFRLEAVPGTELQRYMVSFQEPYLLDMAISMGLSGYYYNRSYREWFEQRIGGRIAWGYQFAPDLSGSVAYRGAKINVTNPIDPTLPEFNDLLGRNLALHGFQAALSHDKRDSAFLATEGHLLEMSFEQVIGSFTYPRAEIDLRKYFTLYERPDGSGRHVLSLASRAGYSGDNTPIYEHFFAGGFSSLRGFEFRGASPHVFSPAIGTNVFVGGQFQLLASAEYLFPITADDMLRGVVFCDTGTVEPSISDWSDSYRVAPGFGLRIVVPAMGPAPIALDFAFPVSWQPGDRFEVFSFFVGFGR